MVVQVFLLLVRGRELHGWEFAVEGLAEQARQLLFQVRNDVVDPGPHLLKHRRSIVDDTVLILRGNRRLVDLLRDLTQRSLPRRRGPYLLVLVVVQLILQFLVEDLDGLDVPVKLVHIRQQTEISLLQADEDLDDFFYVANACARFDRGERLLEHLDVFVMLLDVPSLDGVEERQLQDAALDHGLGKGLLLVRDHVRPAFVALRSGDVPGPVPLRPLLLPLDGPLFDDRLLELVRALVEFAALKFQRFR
mmetsp:Transcript_62564/g.191373  ORF Transcript_62564/g.191373 Transcript_62564/m.191373 type:complete len:249 (+) Transcript_62564:552-1298(+)